MINEHSTERPGLWGTAIHTTRDSCSQHGGSAAARPPLSGACGERLKRAHRPQSTGESGWDPYLRFLLVLWRFLRPWGVIRVTSVFGVRPSPEPACRDGTEDAARRVSSRFKKTAKEAIRDGPETPWLPLAAPRSKLMHAGRVPRCAPWTPPPLNEASSVRARRRALSYVWRRLRMNVGTDWRADHSDIQCTQQRRRSPCSTDAVCMHNGA